MPFDLTHGHVEGPLASQRQNEDSALHLVLSVDLQALQTGRAPPLVGAYVESGQRTIVGNKIEAEIF